MPNPARYLYLFLLHLGSPFEVVCAVGSRLFKELSVWQQPLSSAAAMQVLR